MVSTVLWALAVLSLWGAVYLSLRSRRWHLWSLWHPHGANVGAALRTAERSLWRVSLGPPTRVESLIPDDPATRRRIIEHLRGTHRWSVGDAVVMTERPVGGGPDERAFYILSPVEDDEGTVVYCRSLDSVTSAPGSRTGRAGDIVRAVRERVPEARMVWVARGHVGVGLDADTVTNPAAWARWLREVVDDIDAGRSPGDPPASW